MTISLIAEFTALPGNSAAVTALVAQLTTQVRAEPGNLIFEANHAQNSTDSFVVYETYSDEAAFQAHMMTAHGLQFNVELTPLIVGGKSVLTFLSPIAAALPVSLASPASPAATPIAAL